MGNGRALLFSTVLVFAPPGFAHHSYAMFDAAQVRSVSGTLAKVEWTNPHVFLWIYVPNAATAGGYDLYAFENGSTNVLARRGWSKTSLVAGEKLTVDYWPLRDGRSGGHLKTVTRANGQVMQGAGGPRGVDGTDPPKPGTGAGR
jgi:hypothetical protein